MSSGRVRHWKQRFDKDADFIFLRHLKTGLDPKNPMSAPGDPVPKDDRIAGHRLRRWWEARIIGLANFEAPKSEGEVRAQAAKDAEKEAKKAQKPAKASKAPKAPTAPASDPKPAGKPSEAPAPKGKMKHTGGGWYTVILPGKDPVRVRGKAKAEALLEE